MKQLKATSLALIIGLCTSTALAQQQAQQATSPVPIEASPLAQKNAQATAAANTATTPKVDPVEVKAKAKEHLMYLFQQSLSLPEKERKPYTDLIFAGGLIIHKMDLGQVPPEALDAKLKELDKFYENDRKLSPKEAQKWGDSIAPLTAPPRRY